MPEVIPFTLPKKPRIKEKDAPPDQRKVCVMPIRALTDPKLTDGAVRILALLCSYCNRAGLTWVSQKRLSEDMKTSRQNITNQLAKLRDAGYVEIVRKGFRGERCNTLRVIFDPSITAEEAIIITSNKEDTRPPSMQETPDPAGQARIASLISKAFKQPPTRSKTMPKSGQTRTVREMKDGIRKAQSKNSRTVDKSVDNHQSIGHSPVSNESSPEVSNEALHRQPIGHSTVSYNSGEHIRESIYKESLKRFNTVIGNFEIDELIAHGLTAEQIADSLDTLLPLYRAEGIEPTSAVLATGIRQLQADAR
jgi:DNA-binding transcriptional ArsR family regulator